MNSLPDSMLAKIRHDDGCWTWTGAVNSKGYSSVTNGTGSSMLGHRKSYELLVGAIPAGLTIDHLCENKRCINPAHLEPVTNAENMRRRSERYVVCARGHDLVANPPRVHRRVNGKTSRECVLCARSRKPVNV